MPLKKEDQIKCIRTLSILMMAGVVLLSIQGLILKDPFFTDYALLLIILTLLFITVILYMVVKRKE
ncbi:MAG: hypothetical protein KAR05_10790 [Candidatus Omnitrophica bacterium]|nr:hypothetical protein [Candidatus Omnitrophota bacterium]